MKKAILGVLAFCCGTIMCAQDNESILVQNGYSHISHIDQQGFENNSNAEQDGGGNYFTLEQLGFGNLSNLFQYGNNPLVNNHAEVTQKGNENISYVDQSGINNKAYVDQLRHGTIQAQWNEAEIFQVGTGSVDNIAISSQKMLNNYSYQTQTGEENYGLVSQYRSGNEAYQYQEGINNSATAIQGAVSYFGVGDNFSSSTQTGDNNTVYHYQHDSNLNSASTNQQGDFNNSFVEQMN